MGKIELIGKMTTSKFESDQLLICRKIEGSHTFGVFYGENPLDFSFPQLLLEMSIIVVVTRVLRIVLKPLRQPKIVSEILGGVIIGPSVLGRNKNFATHVFPDNAQFVLKNIGVLGFMYFLFLSGVKMDLAQVRNARKKQWTIAVLGIFLPLFTTGSIAISFRRILPGELGKGASIWGISTALSISAFPALYPIIRDLNLLSSEIGRMALSTAVVTDAIGINIVIAFEAAKQGEKASKAALGYLFSLLIVMVSVIGGLRKLMVWIVRSTPAGKPVDQGYIVVILLGVVVVGFLSDAFGLAIGNGPMWLGLAIPDGPPLGSTLVERSEMIIMEILMPFAYAYVGMMTDFDSMKGLWSSLEPLFYMALVGYLSKVVWTLLVTRFFHMSLRDGLTFSLVMGLRGQVEILLFIHWWDLKMITKPYFTMLVLMTTLITAILTPLICILYDPTKPYRIDKRRSIQHAPPNTRLHIVACIHHEDNVAGIINLLQVSNPTPSSPFSVHALRLVELVGRAAPVFIDQSQAHTNAHQPEQPDSIHNALRFFHSGREETIGIHSYTSVSPQKSMYQDICGLALVKKASLVILPFEEGQDNHINMNVLAHAPCSVGVFLDKGFHGGPNHHIALLFLGGADSREALAYADRMASNPSVSLTVIRFLPEKNKVEEEEDEDEEALEAERKLDDGFVTWFWFKNGSSKKVVYREVLVRNGEDTVAVIKAVLNGGNDFDLWIVGRKRGINPAMIRGMSSWSENNELGVVGDFMASDDFGSSASVLVVQQQVLRGQEMAGLVGLQRRLLSRSKV